MAEITAAMVKELRERSGAGMMDCKKALGETGGDMENAIDWLRKKGLAAAAKKAGRTASEGLVAIAVDGKTGAMVELNAETDFVSRNEQFQKFVLDLAGLALEHGVSPDDLKAADMGGKKVEEALTDLIATIGENMQLRRVARMSVDNGIIASYTHSALVPGAGKIGVLVALHSTADAGKLEELGRQLAMHIASARPEALDISSVDPDALERERAVLKEQALAEGKPAEIVEKMMEGRIRKYYERIVLMEQTFIFDGESKISAVLEKASKELGAEVKLTGYARFERGEGVSKEGDDFASEVAAMAG
ncbi:MAG: elongation factor Ts [Micavibrio sp.]|nr:MAG: elongation factor Ts [Micavibrio sp.]